MSKQDPPLHDTEALPVKPNTTPTDDDPSATYQSWVGMVHPVFSGVEPTTQGYILSHSWANGSMANPTTLQAPKSRLILMLLYAQQGEGRDVMSYCLERIPTLATNVQSNGQWQAWDVSLAPMQRQNQC